MAAPTPTEKTLVILLRHGETEWNLSGRWQGQSQNTPLSERGRAQAEIVARRLRAYPIRAIYSSDLLRAFETARIVGEALGLEPMAEEGLRESDIGQWTGLTWSEIAARFPEEVAAMIAGQDVRRGGGESYGELGARLAATLERVVAQHGGQTVLLVSHGAAIRSLVAHVLGASLAQMHRLEIGGNTALSLISAGNRGLRLVSYNDTAHLDGAGFAVAAAERLEAPARSE